MLIITDGSAINNPGPTGAGAVIKVNGPTSTQIKLAKAVSNYRTSYDGELEAIKISTEYIKDNITDNTKNIHIFVDCQSAIHAITQLKKMKTSTI